MLWNQTNVVVKFTLLFVYSSVVNWDSIEKPWLCRLEGQGETLYRFLGFRQEKTFELSLDHLKLSCFKYNTISLTSSASLCYSLLGSASSCKPDSRLLCEQCRFVPPIHMRSLLALPASDMLSIAPIGSTRPRLLLELLYLYALLLPYRWVLELHAFTATICTYLVLHYVPL